MIERPFWISRIEKAWGERPIVWLSGVRRVGKTSLAAMIPDTVYLNCDLPSTERMLEDPEYFFKSQKKDARIIFDEIHRLRDPSRVLKIAADAFPRLRILATGSSTLAATKKFRDSLTGRKWLLYLPPVLWSECCKNFNVPNLDRRLLHGGLPEALLSEGKKPDFFLEWMDSYYARDIAELFHLRDRAGFLRLLKLVFYQSGGMVDITKLASETGISRPTVKAYLEAMSVAHAIFLIPPFHGGGRREIVRQPKLYGFDTGFVTFARGWDFLREEDRGGLWEHLVLDTLRAREGTGFINFWRDKSGREIDFVLQSGRQCVDAVECKIDPERFDLTNLETFRKIYPNGRNWVVSPKIDTPYTRRFGTLEVHFVPIDHFLNDSLK